MLAVAPVAPIPTHPFLLFLLQVGLLLMLALLFGRLAVRLGMPAVAGELCAGVLLGPSLLEQVAPGLSNWLLPKQPVQFHLLDAFGQIGVLLLVGLTGIHLDFGVVRRQGVTAARISLAGLIVPLAFGIGCGYLLPDLLPSGTAHRSVFALFLGVAMCVSAIPVIAKTLMDMRLLHRNIGQLILTAGTVDDAVGWLMLSVVSMTATTGVHTEQVALSILHLTGVITVTVLIGRPVVRTILRMAARSNEPGIAVATTAAMLLLSAAATHSLGLEAILGAFICGTLIGSSGGLDPARLAPLRMFTMAVLAPVFFASAGLRMDLTTLEKPAVLAAAMVVLLIAILGKFAGAYIGARLSRLSRWEALAVGAGMNARGVIEVVVAMVGLRLGVLSTETYTIVVLVAIATSLMAPPMLRFALERVERTAEEQAREEAYNEGEPGPPRSEVMNFDGETFRAAMAGADAHAPSAHYHQDGDLVWAEFAGGNVRRGSLTGICDQDGTLKFAYCMVLDSGAVLSGRCVSTPERIPDGHIRSREKWQRFALHGSTGVSCIDDVETAPIGG